MKFKKYLVEKKMMKKTMIGFGIDSSVLRPVSDYIESWLIRYKKEYEKINASHISVAQILSKGAKDEFVRLLNTIDKNNYVFEIKNIKLFKGKLDDFIAIEFKKSPEYDKLYNKISKVYDVVKFPGGMKPHSSLFKVKKNSIDEVFLYDVLKDYNVNVKLNVNKLELWNDKFQIEYEKK